MLANPSVTTIVIDPNDDPNGILSLMPGPDGNAPSIDIDEDATPATVVAFRVRRASGAFGAVSVAWSLERLSGTGPVADDLLPVRGVAELANEEREALIRLSPVQEAFPERIEEFRLKLDPASVTGGARVEGELAGVVRLLDSDDAFGAVQFGASSEQKLVRVRALASFFAREKRERQRFLQSLFRILPSYIGYCNRV